MYISKIEIDHFGKWEHETFTFHPNLTVVQPKRIWKDDPSTLYRADAL